MIIAPPGISGAPPDPHPPGAHRAARAVALPAAPMPRGSGMSQPPTPRARSRDAATACRASRGDCGPRNGRKKVAQSGRIRGVFRASVHRWARSPLSTQHSALSTHWSAIGQCTGLGTLSQHRESWLVLHSFILQPFGRRSSASKPGSGRRSRHAGDLRFLRRRNGFEGLGGGVAVSPVSAGASDRRDPLGLGVCSGRGGGEFRRVGETHR
jgi:hypothetical protein